MVISNKPKKPVKKKLNDEKVNAIVEELFENVRKGYQASQNNVNILSNDNYDGYKVDETLFSYENISRLCSGLPYPLSDEQYEIAKKIIKWIREECSTTLQYGKSAPFKRLSGYAGSGKSALISWLITEGFQHFPESIKMKSIAVCSFTWKAALVLQSRGITNACSIHSIFYEIQGADDGKPYFSKRTREEVHSAYSLIIVDEASMVGKFMREDIEYFGVPVLYVGDAGQLPPIQDVPVNGKHFMETAEYNLKEINRQAKDSPIIRLSMDIRNGKFVPYGKYGKFVHKIHAEDLDDELLLKGSKILCGKNETRTNVNRYIRKLKGYDLKAMPYKDEPIIGTGNVLTSGLFNGQEWLSDVDASNYKLTNSMDVSMRFRNEINRVRHNRVIFPQDNLYKSESKGYIMEMIKENDIYPVDFAYAVTVHKCVPLNTLIFNKSGLVTMKHLNNDAPPGLFKPYKEPIEVVSNGKLKPVRAFFNNGVDIVRDYITQLGYSLTATSDHRIQVYDINGGTVRSKVMEQLRVNSETNKVAFIINKGFNIFDGEYQKISINGSEELITEGLAELIGLFHSIGNITTEDELIFTTNNSKITNRIITMINAYFTNPEVTNFNCFVKTKDVTVVEFFKSLTDDVHNILTSPRTVQNRFMLGLFAGGNITKLTKSYSMSILGNYDLFRVIHVALLNYGIVSKLDKRDHNISFLTLEGDNLKLLLSTFGEYGDMESTINYFEYNKLVDVYNPTYPIGKTLQRLAEAAGINLVKSLDNRYDLKTIREVLKNSVNLSDSTEYRFLNDLSNGKIFIDEFVTKSELYTTPTYCLQMKDRSDPWFNQNGILAGNCQGSSYPFPIVYEEHLGNKDFHKKFMYTAVTRAEKKLLLVTD